jgi:transketolase
MTVGTHPAVDLDAQPIDQLTVNTIRTLAMDAVQAANSGHPGTPIPAAYRDEVLPPAVTARVAVEKASPFGWDRWVGPSGAIIGMSTFGESAPMKVLQAKFGFTPENIVATARAQLGLPHADPPGSTLESSD